MTSHLNGSVNGHRRATPQWDGWTPINLGPVDAVATDRAPEPLPEATPAAAPTETPAYDPVALAEADRIRTLAEGEVQARLIEAEGTARAAEILATEKARKERLANDRAERKAAEDQAASDARIAESRRKKADADRAREQADRQGEEQEQAETERAQETRTADDRWRSYAIKFAFACGVVSLPVQMSFFWNPSAPWMAAAPVMLEGAAWVVHRGARAAVVHHRPVWHYRTIVWLLAFVAAAINLYHGLHAFDPGTALATAFASVAGPGVWDLHEHGRIRARDGKLTRRQRKTQEREAKQIAAAEAAERKRAEAERETAERAADEAAQQLAAERAQRYAKVWDHALNLAAAVGETSVTDAVWRRAWRDIHGTDPGETVDIIRGRNAAARRLAAATSEMPGNRPVRATSSQVDQQVPRASRRGHANGPTVRGTRRRGDTAAYSQGARNQARIAAQEAANTPRRKDS